MDNLRIAAAQFEGKNGDKAHNLGAMEALVKRAADKGAHVVSFHEVCIPSYTFMRHCSRDELVAYAEPVPGGESVGRLIEMSRAHGVAVLAGLVEIDGDKLYNTYVCVDDGAFVAKFRKLHAFINPHISCGDEFVTFDLRGWKCGILICYDNNIPENVREVALMGADVVFMPHVTCCLPWPIPGTGLVDKALWDNRESDPVSLRRDFDGPKGREWLLKWLPARAYDNGVYAVFTNPVGVDDDQVRNGNSMILDPFGDIMAECASFEDDVVVGTCVRWKIERSLGRKFLAARRPEIYRELTKPRDQPAVIDPSWDTSE